MIFCNRFKKKSLLFLLRDHLNLFCSCDADVDFFYADSVLCYLIFLLCDHLNMHSCCNCDADVVS